MRLLAGVIAAITVMLLAGWAEATNLTGAAGRPPAPHASLIERESASDLVVLARGDGIRSAARGTAGARPAAACGASGTQIESGPAFPLGLGSASLASSSPRGASSCGFFLTKITSNNPRTMIEPATAADAASKIKKAATNIALAHAESSEPRTVMAADSKPRSLRFI
jgi:hypothetical protein